MTPSFSKEIEIRENEPLHNHSSFRIGGPARFALFPKTQDELTNALRAVREQKLRHIVVGNGSNLLFDDRGFDGVVIFTKKITDVEYIHHKDETLVRVGAGASLIALSVDAGKKHALTGLEFAYGIPGTVGGAVYMNAGAYGGQMSDIVLETEYYDTERNEVRTLCGEEHCFDYRHSFFADHPECIILSTLIKLKNGDPEEILSVMARNKTSREEKQPLEHHSAGSTFKRPGGGLFAGKLIEDAGLKGYSVGDAQISTKHAGFTVNVGHATCADVLAVIEHTEKTVLERFGVALAREIIYIPY